MRGPLTAHCSSIDLGGYRLHGRVLIIDHCLSDRGRMSRIIGHGVVRSGGVCIES